MQLEIASASGTNDVAVVVAIGCANALGNTWGTESTYTATTVSAVAYGTFIIEDVDVPATAADDKHCFLRVWRDGDAVADTLEANAQFRSAQIAF